MFALAATLVEIDTTEPFVGTSTTGVFTHVRGFTGVEAGMDEHIGAFGEIFATLWTTMEDSVLADVATVRLGRGVHGAYTVTEVRKKGKRSVPQREEEKVRGGNKKIGSGEGVTFILQCMN